MKQLNTTLSYLIVGYLALWASAAHAQNFERYRPIAPPVPEPVFPDLKQDMKPVIGSDKVLLKEFQGLIVLDDAGKVEQGGADPDTFGIVRNFANRKSLVYSARFEDIVHQYLGGPVSLRSLNQMSRDIILLYRKRGQPVVDVIIPEQKISEGTVQIVVIESRIGKVLIEDGCYFDGCELSKWIKCTRRGSAIYEPWIENDLFWLNQSPFRKIGVDLRPGSQEGTTDIVFTTEDVAPVRGYFGYDDTGVQTLGLSRLYTGFTLGNVFNADDTIGYQYTTDSDFRRLNAHAVTYTNPINRDYTFQTYASWAGVSPTIGGGFLQGGESWQTGFALVRTLEKSRFVDENLSFGFDFKSTNNNLEFGGINVQNSEAELAQLRVGYHLFERDLRDQYSRFSADAYFSPGRGFSSQNNAAAFSTIRANTAPQYMYGRVRYERAKNISDNWQLAFRGVGQITSDRLLFSEMLGFGGYDTVRGYDQRTANGDHGWLASFEFGPRPIPICIRGQEGRLRLYSFVDSGQAILTGPLPGENAEQTMVSSGVGMRMSVAQNISLRVDYGHGFNNVPFSQSSDRLHLGLVWQFGRLP